MAIFSDRSAVKVLLASALLVSAAVAPLHAAFLTDLNGAVSVDRGNGFVPVTQSTTVTAGTRVMAPANGSVVIQYPNNCQQVVEAGKVVVVVPDSQCANLASSTSGTSGAAGADSTGALIGAGVVAGGAILLLSKANPHSP